MNSTLLPLDLVLVGAGHTNMHIARMWRMKPIPNVQLTLVSPFSRSTYSGMLPGTLAGLYKFEEMEIDLVRFAASCGIRLITAPCVGLDPKSQRVLFEDRPPLIYDVLSIGLGSVPCQETIWKCHSEVLSIKPMPTFLARLEARITERAAMVSSSKPIRIVIVGAGAGGVEVAFSMEVYLRHRGLPFQLAIIDSGDEILSTGYLPSTIRRVRKELERRGIHVMHSTRVKAYSNGELVFMDGSRDSADLVIWSTRAAPPSVLKEMNLPLAEDGFLAVQPTLQTIAGYPVFVVGDSASIVGHELPRAGVYAVREGPILWENIQRIFRKQPLVKFKPQRSFLSLLALGDGRAIGQYKSFSFEGRWAWRWKDAIDRKFMGMYQNYSIKKPMSQKAASHPMKEMMRCRGCGGKVGGNVLRAALERLKIPPSRFARQGLDKPDDAALLNPQAGMLDVLSVDFFQAFLEDPYLVGRVAALNALSDLWAMGSEPATAMAMVTLPNGPAKQQTELLYQVLAGGLRELQEAGISLLGGHTLEGPHLMIGYSVLGQLHGRVPFTKGGLRPGDCLVLTKPLGSGVLLAAHAEAKCKAAWMDALLSNLVQSNAIAARLAREFDAHGVTDVTGFGLAGHLLEMLYASKVSACLSLGALPLLNGFTELASAGYRSTLDPANREVEPRMRLWQPALSGSIPYHSLFDPQTSGGLLIGVSANRAEEFVAKLRKAGNKQASLIGTIMAEDSAGLLQITQ